MKKRLSMDEALYLMGHKSKVSIKDAAEKMGMGKSLLYRMLNSFDKSAHFPATLLTPAMQTFKNVTPLKVLAQRLGYLLVKPKRGNANKAKTLADYQLEFSKLMQQLLAFFAKQSTELSTTVFHMLDEHMESTAHLKASCERNSDQLELSI